MEVRIEIKDSILRKVEIKDKEVLHKIRNEDHILKWIPNWKNSEERIEEWIVALTFAEGCRRSRI